MGRQNPIELVQQINDQTAFTAEATSEGKIAVMDGTGKVYFEISNGDEHTYLIVKYNGTVTQGVETNEQAVEYLNGEF